jgi:hypothetical protein
MTEANRTDEQAYAQIRCHGDSVPGHSCGVVGIDEDEYIHQLVRPNSLWCCPHCGSTATFDDTYFEKRHGIE